MKYRINPIPSENFTPFTLTLEFTNRKEWTHFHDKIMGQITQTPCHPFHNDFYNAQFADQTRANSEGEI